MLHISDNDINKVYTNKQIADIFECSTQGGMRRSLKTNTLVLICSHDDPLYDDYWNEEQTILMYTGMGTKGDQSVDFSQNKTLKESNTNGVKCHLFESYESNKYIYRGLVCLAGEIDTTKREFDIEQNLRKVVKFPLRRITQDGIPNTRPIEITEDYVIEAEKEKAKHINKYSNETIRIAAINKENRRVAKKMITTHIERDAAVSQYTKNRAMGKCDLCQKEAPFYKKDGTPYLETHHVIALADKGPDVVYNTVALCPNCHRKLHVRKDKTDRDSIIETLRNYVENEDNLSNIEKFKELFHK